MLDMLLVAAIAIGALVLFVREVLPADLVAVLVLVTLATLHLVTPEQALSGFSNAATLTVAAMFVLSAGLRESGALDRLGRSLVRVAANGPVLLVVTVISVAGISAFINNTATVAVMLPLVLAACRKRNVAPSKLLIPLSYASQFGGACTLIGTSTNLLVNSLAIGAGNRGFGLFEFAPVGLVLVGVGTLYLALIGWWLLPSRSSTGSLEESYALRDYMFALRVDADSRFAQRTIAELTAARRGAVRVVEVLRHERQLLAEPNLLLQVGDTLVVEGPADELLDMSRHDGLTATGADVHLESNELQLLEVIVGPGSRAIGRPTAEIRSPWSARAVPLAIASRGSIRPGGLAAPLAAGDVLLFLVAATDVAAVREDPDFIVLSERTSPMGPARRAPLALLIVAAVVGAAATAKVSIPIVALLGAAAMVVTRCVSLDRAYRAVDLRVLVLLAAMFPLGVALEQSGAARALVASVLGVLSDSPRLALAVVYGLTMLLTEFVSNNATAVLMTPIAMVLATQLGVDAAPFLAAVAFAASTSFSTPIGYQTNSMVYNAGGYAFRDFLRVGVPLNLLFWLVSVLVIPRVFPF